MSSQLLVIWKWLLASLETSLEKSSSDSWRNLHASTLVWRLTIEHYLSWTCNSLLSSIKMKLLNTSIRSLLLRVFEPEVWWRLLNEVKNEAVLQRLEGVQTEALKKYFSVRFTKSILRMPMGYYKILLLLVQVVFHRIILFLSHLTECWILFQIILFLNHPLAGLYSNSVIEIENPPIRSSSVIASQS